MDVQLTVERCMLLMMGAVQLWGRCGEAHGYVVVVLGVM